MKYLIITFFIAIASLGNAQNSIPGRIKHINHENTLAIQGYDPVSYFQANKATKGLSSIVYKYQGITYQFASEKSRAEFIKNPSKYEPQYGGWCAFAMGDYGKKVEVDPETFKILDGKLYLFYNAYFNNTLTSWNKNEKVLKQNADKNWSNFINK